MDLDKKSLISGDTYYLRWDSKKIKNYYIILECEFIKYYDDRFIEDFIIYLDEIRLLNIIGDENVDHIHGIHTLGESLVNNNILKNTNTTNLDYIKFKNNSFDDPLYPYKYVMDIWRNWNSEGHLDEFEDIPAQFVSKPIGLFKYIRPVKIMIDGRNFTNDFIRTSLNMNTVNNSNRKTYRISDDNYRRFTNWPPKFVESYKEFNAFIKNIHTNTFVNGAGHSLMPNKTLFWADLTEFRLINAIKQRMIHNKTLKGLTEKLGRDPTVEISGFIGAQETRDILEHVKQPNENIGKGGKKKSYKKKQNKRKTRKHNK